MQNKKEFMPYYQVRDSPVAVRRIFLCLKQQQIIIKNTLKAQSADKTMFSFLSPKDLKKFNISQNAQVNFSEKVTQLSNYIGLASSLLASAYSFCVKSTPSDVLTIYIPKTTPEINQIIQLAKANIKAKQWANGRGDFYGSSAFFLKQSQRIAHQNNLRMIWYSSEQLLKEGFRLHHAVGRGSQNPPTFINLSYNGNKDSTKWTAFVGKGILFDTGGLNLKQSEQIKTMYLDKHAACCCLSAFEEVVLSKLPINLTVSLGIAQNFISSKSYRPSDIIRSRKGLTVKIADTDAEGRLVLADAMNWTQQNYEISELIQISTLTYSCMKALGRFHGGVYGNNQELMKLVLDSGKVVCQEGWILPLTQDHHQMLDCNQADCLSDVDDCPGGSIGAAFLQKFVEPGVKWVHLDVLGVSIDENGATGWGARLLYELAKVLSKKT